VQRAKTNGARKEFRIKGAKNLVLRISASGAKTWTFLYRSSQTGKRCKLSLEQWQSRAGLGNSPRTILEELAAIQSTDVVLPTATLPERELRLRCVVRPNRAQAALLQRLGLRLPERLRMPTGARQM
jgi:hypothetical protein